MFISGRDKNFHPIIQMNTDMLNYSIMCEESYIEAMITLLDISVRYMHIPGKIETNMFIIDTNHRSMFDLPYGILKNIIYTTSIHYPLTLEKLYILNPSLSLIIAWKIISSFLQKDSLQKIQFIKSNEFHKLKENIPEDQLLEIYGGKNKIAKPFWPPKSTISLESIDEAKETNKSLERLKYHPMYKSAKWSVYHIFMLKKLLFHF